MGASAVLLVAALAGGAAVASSRSKPGSTDMPSLGLTNQDVEPEDLGTQGGARKILLSGTPQGILTPGTTGRARLLGNL